MIISMRKDRCDGKIPYNTRDEAQNALLYLIRRKATRKHRQPNIYPCPDCGFFHIGHSGGRWSGKKYAERRFRR